MFIDVCSHPPECQRQQWHGVQVYMTGEGKRAIILVHDIFGFDYNQARLPRLRTPSSTRPGCQRKRVQRGLVKDWYTHLIQAALCVQLRCLCKM